MPTPVHAARAEAVLRTMNDIRAIESAHGATMAGLERIKPALIALASRTELFPPGDFAVPAGRPGSIYRLAEDADRRFALYASAGVGGKKQPPHNHTTWAAIAGVFGDEHNVFYRRTDDRTAPGQGVIEKTGELTVRRGNAVAFLPDDFHTIEVLGAGPSLHLHCYGMSLENLPDRIFFPDVRGGPYKNFPASPNIRTVALSPAALKAAMAGDAPPILIDARDGKPSGLPGALSLAQAEGRLTPTGATVVYDASEDGLAERAALALMHRGCRNIAVLAGGLAAWIAAER